MDELCETILRLRMAQLENKIILCEALLEEPSRIENVQRVARDVKYKIEKIIEIWKNHEDLNGCSVCDG